MGVILVREKLDTRIAGEIMWEHLVRSICNTYKHGNILSENLIHNAIG